MSTPAKSSLAVPASVDSEPLLTALGHVRPAVGRPLSKVNVDPRAL